MYRIIILIFISVIMMPEPAYADIECYAKTKPRINVKPQRGRIKYDFTKNKQQLSNVDVDTISPYGANHQTSVGGLMSGSIQVSTDVSFMTETHQHLGRGCVFINEINVKIDLNPTIYVASEFPKGGCMHNVILAHEYKHVDVDRLVINKYVNLIGRELSQRIDTMGSTFGPMRLKRMRETQVMVKDELHGIIIRMNDEMTEERRKRQQAIDNIEEYEAIGKRCKSRNNPRRR